MEENRRLFIGIAGSLIAGMIMLFFQKSKQKEETVARGLSQRRT